MNHTIPAILGIVCLIAAAVAGCTGMGNGGKGPAPTPSGTAIPVRTLVASEWQNGATVTVDPMTTITLKLPENPTTGYQWNLTLTPGLTVTGDTYEPSDTTGKLVGSGGTRIWQILAAGTGTQQIHAVYTRSWEPVTGNETAFSMTVDIAKA